MKIVVIGGTGLIGSKLVSRLGERAGRERSPGSCDDRGLAGGQAGGQASWDQIRLDVEVDVTRRRAGVGHGVEGLVVQAGSGWGSVLGTSTDASAVPREGRCVVTHPKESPP